MVSIFVRWLYKCVFMLGTCCHSKSSNEFNDHDTLEWKQVLYQLLDEKLVKWYYQEGNVNLNLENLNAKLFWSRQKCSFIRHTQQQHFNLTLIHWNWKLTDILILNQKVKILLFVAEKVPFLFSIFYLHTMKMLTNTQVHAYLNRIFVFFHEHVDKCICMIK